MREIMIGGLGLAAIALLTLIVYQNHQRHHRPLMTTTYQAVVLSNGTVLYGRLDHLGTNIPVLRDAFSVSTDASPQAGERKLTLTKRNETETGADHVIIPVSSIVSVEPIRPDSAIGRAISAAGWSR